MGLGDVFGTTFAIYKAGFKEFLAQMWKPVAVTALASILASGAGFASGFGSTVYREPGWLIGGGVMGLVGLVLIFVGSALLIKASGAITWGAIDLGQGRPPAYLDDRSKGVIGRVFPISLAIGFVFGLVMSVVMILIFAVGGAAAFSSFDSSDPSVAIGSGFLTVFVAMLAYAVMVIVLAYLEVRWIYLVQVATVEGLSGIAALKRSWELTQGNFWRTFGYYYVFNLLLGTVMSMILTPMMVMGPLLAQGTIENGDVEATMLTLFIALAVMYLVMWALVAFVQPLNSIFLTVMYTDQNGRNQLAAVGPYDGYQQPMPPYGQPQPPQHRPGVF